MPTFSNIKIIIVIGAFLPIPPLRGGAVEKRWLQLAKEFVKQGAQITMISRSYNGLAETECDKDGVHHLRLAGYEAPQSLLIRLLLDLFYSLRVFRSLPNDADIIVTNTFWLPAIMHGRLRGRTYIDVARVPKGQMWLYRGVGRLRANSTPVFKSILKELKDHRSKSVSIIPNPLPFDPSRTTDIAERKRTLLFVGRVHPEKGLHLLVRALKLLPDSWSLRIVGPWSIADGGGGDSYVNSLKMEAIGIPIEITGPIYEPIRLNVEYQTASVFVYPSVAEQGETFGLAPLEAMAWGCVPIVSNLDCFKDFISDQINGLVFDHRSADAVQALAACISKLMRDNELRERLSKAAAGVQQSHSAAAIAQRFLGDFNDLLLMQRENHG